MNLDPRIPDTGHTQTVIGEQHMLFTDIQGVNRHMQYHAHVPITHGVESSFDARCPTNLPPQGYFAF